MTDLVVEYHRLYAKYKRPEYREIIENLAHVQEDTFTERWISQINQKCKEQGIPLLYPQP